MPPRKTSRDAETQAYSIRITHGARADLESIATRTGLEVSQLIRFGIDGLIRYAEANNGVLRLPIEFGKSDDSDVKPS